MIFFSFFLSLEIFSHLHFFVIPSDEYKRGFAEPKHHTP